MPSAFSPAADFSEIAARERLHLFEVVHKTFFTLEERGLEAGAATGAIVRPVSRVPSVRIDRPFVTVLRDKPTGQVLFLGHVVDPSAH